MMGTHIFDIDGTIVKYHTNEWIIGAKETIKKLYDNGNRIIFITMRDEIRDKNEIWSVENTKNFILKDLDDIDVKYDILFNVPSPRTIHDDSQIITDRRRLNENYGNKILCDEEYVDLWFNGEGIDYSNLI